MYEGGIAQKWKDTVLSLMGKANGRARKKKTLEAMEKYFANTDCARCGNTEDLASRLAPRLL